MSYKNNTHAERERVDAEGKRAFGEGRQAFDEHQRRGYNPHAASNLTLAVLWWHGWDTAEEEKESKSERSPLDEHPI